MKPKLFIVTGAPFKFADLSFKLKDYFDCEQKPWDEPEIQGDPIEILKHKANRAYDKFQHPVLVDDVSVHIEDLGGFPGPYMKDFWNCFTPEELGKKFKGSKIKAICRLGLKKGPEDLVIAEGEFNGVIVAPSHNNHQGRFFELCVKLNENDKIMLDYTEEERAKLSHRGKAMEKLLEIINEK
jgi:inosine triphosphate pyrophosphatase